jgi:hypothetical protein
MTSMPYAFHPSFVDPQNDDARVWRYMDLAKLLATIDREALFFPASATLAKNDQFEGQPPFPEIYKSEHYRQLPLFYHLNFFSCWHMNNDESDAMWKIYVKDGAGIAIQSTVGRLKRCFAKVERPVHIGVVQYIDYDQTPSSVGFLGNSWFLFKRKAFEHEREIRIGVWSDDAEIRYLKDDGSIGFPEDHDRQEFVLKHPGISGVYVPVDLDILIDKIVIAPQSPPWFTELVSSITSRLGYNFAIEASGLLRTPPLSLLG